jgi:integrase
MPKNLHITVPRLGLNRHGVFFVRFPSSVDANGRRTVVQQSLRTKSPALAKILALRFCLQLAEGETVSSNDHRHGTVPWIANPTTGEFSAEGEDDQRRLMEFMKEYGGLLKSVAEKAAFTVPTVVHVQQAPALPAADMGKALKLLVPLHLQKEASIVESSQTVHEKKVVLSEFMLVFGEDAGIRSITTERITEEWTPVELERPNKKYKGKTLSRTRLEKRRGYLSKFFKWAKTSKYYSAENPMAVQMASKAEIKAQTTSYAEFTGDDLAQLFNAKYVTYMDKPDWYWPPLLALHSGARLGEICSLEIDAIKIIEGAYTYEILKGKTAESERVVPIHSALIKLGFWGYVEALRAKGETYLFPGCSSRDAVAKSAGRQWGLWIDACGIKDSRKTFHSFRSTAITDLHNTSATAPAIRKAVGHSTEALAGSHGTYVRAAVLRTLTEAIEKLQHPTINFDAFNVDDPTFRAYFEKKHALANDSKKLAKAKSNEAHLVAAAARTARSRRGQA